MAEQATIDAVTARGAERYKYGFVTDIESEKAPKGLSADTVRYISAKKNEPDWMLEWRLAAFERWQSMREPRWARVKYPADRLSGRLLLFGAEIEAEARQPRSGRSETARNLQEARYPDHRAKAAGRRRRRCRVRQRVRGDDVQGKAEGSRRYLLPDVRGAADAPRTRAQIFGLRRAGHGQFLRDAELGRLQRRLVRLRAAGRALPDGAVDLFPHQRGRNRPVRTHADHRRQGFITSPISKVAPRRCATRTSSTRRSSN